MSKIRFFEVQPEFRRLFLFIHKSSQRFQSAQNLFEQKSEHEKVRDLMITPGKEVSKFTFQNGLRTENEGRVAVICGCLCE